jgi:hypothetical protein
VVSRDVPQDQVANEVIEAIIAGIVPAEAAHGG